MPLLWSDPRSPDLLRPHPVVVVPGLLALLLLASASAAQELVVPSTPGGRLEVEFDLGEGLRPDPGSLTLRSHDRDEIRLEVEAEGWSSWGIEPRLDPGPGRVRAEVRVTGATSWMFGGPQVRVAIWVPRKTSVELRAKGGPVRIEDLDGSVRARVRGGDVEIRGIGGDVKLRVQEGHAELEEIDGAVDVTSTDGAVVASWIRGDVEVRGSIGSIRLDHLGSRATAKTLEGDVEISGAAGPVEARTEDGQIQVSFDGPPRGALVALEGNLDVQVPAGEPFVLEADVTRGEIDIAETLVPTSSRDDGPGRVHAPVGSGGGRLVLRSSRGWIRVHGR